MTDNLQIRIAASALKAIRDEVARNATGVETGGALLAAVEDGELTILFALGPGPNAIRTPAMFEKDPVYTVREALRLRRESGRPNLFAGGDWHLHGLHGLSGGDERTLHSVSAEIPGYVAIAVCSQDGSDIRAYSVVDGTIAQHELLVVEDASESLDFSRTRQLADPETVRNLHLLIVGQGSGGSLATMLLATTGIEHFILADHDRVERVNGPRHIAKLHHMGMRKTDVLMSEIRAKNPRIVAATIEVALSSETREVYRDAAMRSDAVVACSGDPTVNDELNELCVGLGKPAIYAGSFARAAGGLVFVYDPRNEDAPCLNCLFERGSGIRPDTTEALEHLARDYGLSENELHAQQGLFVDIAFVATLTAKVALATLLQGEAPSLPELPGNLVVWDSQTLSTRWASVARRSDCAVCNPDGWLAAQEAALEVE